MSPFVLSVINSALNLAYPQRCHGCAQKVKETSLGIACAECWASTSLFNTSDAVCPKCGLPNENSEYAFDCRECSAHDYDIARSVGIYENALRSSVLHLKRFPVLPGFLTSRIRSTLETMDFADADVIVPVPLSPQRLTDRGFNQAEVIAHRIGKIVSIPVDSASLVRRKHTPMHRAAMDRKARQLTVENAFSVTRPKLISEKKILLVDDIFTSGATASNCAKALKKKGAGKVAVFTLARTRY